jgi:hypothetical protein
VTGHDTGAVQTNKKRLYSILKWIEYSDRLVSALKTSYKALAIGIGKTSTNNI